jgi:hypothetical protein
VVGLVIALRSRDVALPAVIYDQLLMSEAVVVAVVAAWALNCQTLGGKLVFCNSDLDKSTTVCKVGDLEGFPLRGGTIAGQHSCTSLIMGRSSLSSLEDQRLVSVVQSTIVELFCTVPSLASRRRYYSSSTGPAVTNTGLLAVRPWHDRMSFVSSHAVFLPPFFRFVVLV